MLAPRTPRPRHVGRARLAVILAALCTGCANIDFDQIARHAINCNGEGEAIDPKTERVLDATEVEAWVGHILESADRGFDERSGVGTRRLLIHVHGGLNNWGTSLSTAQRVVLRMSKEKAEDWHYPIFFTWDSGPISSWWEHLAHLRAGRHAPLWGPLTAPVILASDMAVGAARTPRGWLYQMGSDAAFAWRVGLKDNLLPSWQNAKRARRALVDPVAPRDPSRMAGLRHGFVNAGAGKYHRNGWNHAGRLLLYFATLPAQLATSAVVVHGMGQGAWEGMLHSATNLFYRYDEFDLRTIPAGERKHLQEPVRDALRTKPTGPFAVFLRQLAAHLESEMAKGRAYEITLVGHSMGAIILNDALSLMSGSDALGALPIKDIVYMAPACSIREAEVAIVPYLKMHEDAHFHVLTLHPVAEADELGFLGLVPRGSLLEWIDHYYSKPAGPQDRRLGKWANVMQALHLFRDVADRVTIKAFGVRNDSIPQKHGEFNDCPFWRAEFRDPTRAEFYPPDWDDLQ